MEAKERKEDEDKKPERERPEPPSTPAAFPFEQIINGILDADPKAIERHQAKRRRNRKAKKHR